MQYVHTCARAHVRACTYCIRAHVHTRAHACIRTYVQALTKDQQRYVGQMQQAYSSACTESGATPISRVHNQLDAPRLSLPHYGLGARGAVALSTLLPLNHSWRVFDLRDNAIGQVGALAIGAGLTD